MWVINLLICSFCTGGSITLWISETISGGDLIPPFAGQLQNIWCCDAWGSFLSCFWLANGLHWLLVSICFVFWVVLPIPGKLEFCCILSYAVLSCIYHLLNKHITSVADLNNPVRSFSNKHLGAGVWDLRPSWTWTWAVGFDLWPGPSMCLICSISYGCLLAQGTSSYPVTISCMSQPGIDLLCDILRPLAGCLSEEE